jgi:hypothetical protein
MRCTHADARAIDAGLVRARGSDVPPGVRAIAELRLLPVAAERGRCAAGIDRRRVGLAVDSCVLRVDLAVDSGVCRRVDGRFVSGVRRVEPSFVAVGVARQDVRLP